MVSVLCKWFVELKSKVGSVLFPPSVYAQVFLFWQQGNKNPNTRKSTLRRFALTSTPQSNQYIDTLYNKPQETGLDFFVIIFVINKLPSYSRSFLLNRVHELGQRTVSFSVLNYDILVIICLNSKCLISSSFAQNLAKRQYKIDCPNSHCLILKHKWNIE